MIATRGRQVSISKRVTFNSEGEHTHDVGDELLRGHVNVSDGNTHAENLLQLELNGGLDLGDLAGEIVAVGDWSREFTSLGETGTQETRDLLDERVGSDESIVLASKLLNQLLVLVELLQVIGGHGINATVLSTIDIVLVTENADAHVWAGNDWQADSARETLVTLGVIVLEADLEFDGFEEVSLLLLERVLEKAVNVGTHSSCAENPLANA